MGIDILKERLADKNKTYLLRFTLVSFLPGQKGKGTFFKESIYFQ